MLWFLLVLSRCWSHFAQPRGRQKHGWLWSWIERELRNLLPPTGEGAVKNPTLELTGLVLGYLLHYRLLSPEWFVNWLFAVEEFVVVARDPLWWLDFSNYFIVLNFALNLFDDIHILVWLIWLKCVFRVHDVLRSVMAWLFQVALVLPLVGSLRSLIDILIFSPKPLQLCLNLFLNHSCCWLLNFLLFVLSRTRLNSFHLLVKFISLAMVSHRRIVA